MGVEGYREFCAYLDRVVAECEDAKWLKDATDFVKDEAIRRVPIYTGNLAASIKTEYEETDQGIMGVVFSDEDYATFVELGTGPKGAASHSGISPNVNAQWGDGPWYVPVERIPNGGRYHWRVVRGKDGKQYYEINGQAAHPFLYPALADNRDEIIRRANKGIADAIKGR